jgi:hypothetical protein
MQIKPDSLKKIFNGMVGRKASCDLARIGIDDNCLLLCTCYFVLSALYYDMFLCKNSTALVAVVAKDHERTALI